MKYIQNTGLALFLLGLLLFSAIPFFGEFKLTDDDLQEVLKEEHYGKLSSELSPMLGKTYSSNIAFVKDFNQYFDKYNNKFKSNKNWKEMIWDDYAFVATKAATLG